MSIVGKRDGYTMICWHPGRGGTRTQMTDPYAHRVIVRDGLRQGFVSVIY